MSTENAPLSLQKLEEKLRQKRAPNFIDGLEQRGFQENFLGGIRQLFEVLVEEQRTWADEQHNKPLVFVFPWRGSGPVYWALDEECRRRGFTQGLEEFGSVLTPPVGTAHDMVTGANVGAIEEKQKTALLQKFFETLIQEKPFGLGEKNNIRNVILIDEVQSGGMITRMMHTLLEVLGKLWSDEQRPFVTVIAMQDESAYAKAPKNKDFVNLLRGQLPPRVKFQAIPLPLFVDVEAVVPAILALPKATQHEREHLTLTGKMHIAETRETIGNIYSERAIRHLVRQQGK